MRGRLAVLAFVALAGLSGGARAQKDHAPLTLDVACGPLDRAPCAQVLPRLAATAQGMMPRMMPGVTPRVTPRGVEAMTALNAMTGICQARPTAAAALVPRDAIGSLTYCAVDLVGGPLWPAYALLVVRAGTPFRHLGDLTREAAGGRKRVIAADDAGQIMLDRLLRANPVWRRALAVTRENTPTGLSLVASGNVDAFFTVEAPDGDWVERIRRMTTSAGKPLYGFLDIHPAVAFFQEDDGKGHCLYRRTGLDVGGTAPVTTVATDVVMVLAAKSRDMRAAGGPRVADVLAAALEATRAGILTDMRVPRDWRPAGVACRARQTSTTETSFR